MWRYFAKILVWTPLFRQIQKSLNSPRASNLPKALFGIVKAAISFSAIQTTTPSTNIRREVAGHLPRARALTPAITERRLSRRHRRRLQQPRKAPERSRWFVKRAVTKVRTLQSTVSPGLMG